MDAAPYDLRLATAEDLPALRASVRRTLHNPEGKSGRKTFSDAIERGELLVLVHRERAGAEHVEGFVEWHSRVDGMVTIRDAGSAGDETNVGHLKRLVRELLRMAAPPSATVKVDADQPAWNQVFQETAGFKLEGQEYTRPKYKNIWTWDPQSAAEAARRANSPVRAGGPPRSAVGGPSPRPGMPAPGPRPPGQFRGPPPRGPRPGAPVGRPGPGR